MTVTKYIKSINQRFKTGISREHSYRGDLQNLLEDMLTNILVTNEPAGIDCGAQDYILTFQDIPVGYLEAKDIGEPLTGWQGKIKERNPKWINDDYVKFLRYGQHFFEKNEGMEEIS